LFINYNVIRCAHTKYQLILDFDSNISALTVNDILIGEVNNKLEINDYPLMKDSLEKIGNDWYLNLKKDIDIHTKIQIKISGIDDSIHEIPYDSLITYTVFKNMHTNCRLYLFFDQEVDNLSLDDITITGESSTGVITNLFNEKHTIENEEVYIDNIFFMTGYKIYTQDMADDDNFVKYENSLIEGAYFYKRKHRKTWIIESDEKTIDNNGNILYLGRKYTNINITINRTGIDNRPHTINVAKILKSRYSIIDYKGEPYNDYIMFERNKLTRRNNIPYSVVVRYELEYPDVPDINFLELPEHYVYYTKVDFEKGKLYLTLASNINHDKRHFIFKLSCHALS
jgi:hypothetical protein